MKYDVIIVDPPWQPGDKLKNKDGIKRGAADNYETIATKDLAKLEVNKLANPTGSVLVLWSLGSMLEDAMYLMKEWGFSQKQVLVWVKTKKKPTKELEKCLGFGLGRLFRQTHEIALIGINNTGIYKKLKNKSQRSVIFSPNIKHSSKPEILQDNIDIMFGNDVKKCEIFARRERSGYDCIGNECPSTLNEDIIISIKNLIDK